MVSDHFAIPRETVTLDGKDKSGKPTYVVGHEELVAIAARILGHILYSEARIGPDHSDSMKQDLYNIIRAGTKKWRDTFGAVEREKMFERTVHFVRYWPVNPLRTKLEDE